MTRADVDYALDCIRQVSHAGWGQAINEGVSVGPPFNSAPAAVPPCLLTAVCGLAVAVVVRQVMAKATGRPQVHAVAAV